MASERTPLLQNDHDDGPSTANDKSKLGPMEISATNRRAILAGIWIATFLGVSCVATVLFGVQTLTCNLVCKQ